MDELIKKLEDLVGQPIANPEEFLSGMRDAKHGRQHKQGMGSEYDRGFSTQYQLEQLLGER